MDALITTRHGTEQLKQHRHLRAATPDSNAADWQALAVLVAAVALEACLLGLRHGAWMTAYSAFPWMAVPGLSVLGGWWWQVARHQAEYRAARVRWPWIVGQGAAFAGVLAVLGSLSKAPFQEVLFDVRSLFLLAVPTTAWLFCSAAAVAPRPRLAAELLVTTFLCGVFGAATVGLSYLTELIWDSSGDMTVGLVESLLTPFAGGPVRRPERFVIGTDSFAVRITHDCAGFQGIGLVTTLLAGYLWWFRDSHRFPQAFLLVPIGIVFIWLANLLRITALILVGIWISPAIAIDGFHSTAGWMAFVTVGLGIIYASSRMRFFVRPEMLPAGGPVLGLSTAGVSPAGPGSSGLATAPAHAGVHFAPLTPACVLPFVALGGITMLTQAFTSGFDVLYPVRVVCVAAVLLVLRRAYPIAGWRWSFVPVAIGAVAFAAWMALAPGAGPADLAAERSPAQLGQPWAAAWLLFRVAGSMITVPIAEELFFRGFLVRRCIDADADRVPVGRLTWLAFAVSSVAFGVLHGQAWLAGIVAGMLFAAALVWRGRLADAIVAHATTNALLSGYVITTGSWTQWG